MSNRDKVMLVLLAAGFLLFPLGTLLVFVRMRALGGGLPVAALAVVAVSALMMVVTLIAVLRSPARHVLTSATNQLAFAFLGVLCFGLWGLADAAWGWEGSSFAPAVRYWAMASWAWLHVGVLIIIFHLGRVVVRLLRAAARHS